jgi:hypothetical protein
MRAYNGLKPEAHEGDELGCKKVSHVETADQTKVDLSFSARTGTMEQSEPYLAAKNAFIQD